MDCINDLARSRFQQKKPIQIWKRIVDHFGTMKKLRFQEQENWQKLFWLKWEME